MEKYRKIVGMLTTVVLTAALLSGCGSEDDLAQELQVEKIDEQENANSKEVSEGYEAVKNGTAKVKYLGKADIPGYLELSQVLTVGQSVTIQEICEAFKSIEAFECDPEITYSMIDCGSDGNQELLVQAQLSAMFGIQMIIKEIDGEFVICYDQSTTDRSYVTVNQNGTIESGGSSAANIHVVDYAYVDANGEYKFFYGVVETLSFQGDTYDIYKDTDKISIPGDGIDADHMAILEYYFEQDYTQRNSFYSFYTFNDDFSEEVTEEGEAQIKEFASRFENAGFKTYSSTEIEDLLKDRAAQIGYPY